MKYFQLALALLCSLAIVSAAEAQDKKLTSDQRRLFGNQRQFCAALGRLRSWLVRQVRARLEDGLYPGQPCHVGCAHDWRN
jgi:hypothetical protein